MPLFELQRIWDAWPNIYNHQVLRELFRQVSTPTIEAGADGGTIDRVFVIPGHVLVATNSKKNTFSDSTTQEDEGDVQLYAFSRIPLREEPVSCDDHVIPYLLPLNNKCRRVVNVIDLTRGPSQRIVVLQDCGILSLLEYNPVRAAWELKEEITFGTFSDSLVHDAILHLPSLTLLFNESSQPSHPHTSHSSQVTARSLELSSTGSVCLGTPTVILTHTPPLSLVGFEEGVCFLPTVSPYPKGLLLFWTPSVCGKLSALVWNSTHTCPSPLVTGNATPPTFKALTLRLAGSWTKTSQNPSLVAMETNPLTGQLLALASDGVLYHVTVDKQSGTIRRIKLTKLSDFAQRNPTLSDVFSTPLPYHQPRLFCVQTYYGYCLKGELRIYDGFTGEFVWECDDHEGAGSLLWTTPTPSGFCGVHGNSGMWLLKSHKASDHAHFMATALFPIATNADETTPGDYLDSGQLLAAKLSKLWNLQLLATKYSLEGAFDTAKSHVDENNPKDRETFLPHLHHELISLLREDSLLQNPALLVALLAEYPEYRQQLSDCVSTFLDHYRSNDSSNIDLLTPLNTDIVPILEEYLQLTREFDSKLEELELPKEENCGHDVRGKICRLLENTEAATVSDVEVEASSRALFHSLCAMDSLQAMLGIKDFFAVKNFDTAIEELKNNSWSSTRNWRGILATESAVRIQRSYMRTTTNHLPLFEEMCRLLYQTAPSELLPFVTFAQLVRDYQAQGDSAFARKCRKNFFFHRALNALPMFISPDATPTSWEAIQSRCQLLLRSDFLNAHMSCLQLLLSNEMWADAISLVEEVKSKEAPHCALFHCLLVSLAKGCVLHRYVDEVWKLLPKEFNVFDFVGALKTSVSGREEGAVLLPDNSTQLTVSSVGSKLLVLLKQANLDLVNR